MKSTGIVRRVDSLGRIVLPIELRRLMDMDIKDEIEIFVDGEQILLAKYQPRCVFCNSTDNVITHNDKNICTHCVEELKKR